MTTTTDTQVDLDATLASLADSLVSLGRTDLRARVDAGRVRASRPATVVCVVGEFKQGKSSLVNGLVGTDVCPVDDDIATAAITLVRHGNEPAAIVRYRADSERPAERVPIASIGDVVTDAARDGRDDRAGGQTPVERVDVMVPSRLLADGLVLVDTPGMGGLGAGHAAATLSFLPFADGLIFVSDVSSELTATELDFLGQARELCPYVVIAAPKTDIAPQWRRLVDIDREHLAQRSIDVPIVAVSSTLRADALETRDRTLNERSGFPQLLDLLETEVISPARSGAEERVVTEALEMIEAVTSSMAAEREALDDPDARERLATAAAAAKERLDALRSGGARWQSVLGDRVTDLSSEVSHRFRGSIRAASRDIEEQIETLKTAEEWDGLARALQAAAAEAVATAFRSAEEGRTEIRHELAALLAADEVVGPRTERRLDVLDTNALWRSRGLDPSESSGGKVFRTGITGLRGAQGGVLLLGVSGQFLPQAAAVFIASNPVLLGAGALFGGFQLLEDRKRRLQARRQAARTQLRQFTDDVQFEVTNELTKLLRDVQRDLRDEFVELIGELQQSWATAAQHAEQAAAEGAGALQRRRQLLDEHSDRLHAVQTALSSFPRSEAAA